MDHLLPTLLKLLKLHSKRALDVCAYDVSVCMWLRRVLCWPCESCIEDFINS